MMTIKNKKKVTFDETKNKVYHMIALADDYKQARKGEWECAARDRVRFERRISMLDNVISKVLDPKHRLCIYHERFNG